MNSGFSFYFFLNTGLGYLKHTKYEGRTDECTHSQLNPHLRRSPKDPGSASPAVQSRSSLENKGKKRRDRSSAWLSLRWVVSRPVFQTSPQNHCLLLNSCSKLSSAQHLGGGIAALKLASAKNTLIGVWTKPAWELLCKASKVHWFPPQRGDCWGLIKSKMNQVNALQIHKGCRFTAGLVYIITNKRRCSSRALKE